MLKYQKIGVVHMADSIYDLGSRIRELCKANGLSQKELGEKVHRSKSAINTYENGAQIPPLEAIIALAAALHTDIASLVDLDEGQKYTINGLSEEEQQIVHSLFKEFSQTTAKRDGLTENQINLLNQLCVYFYKKNSL